MIDLSELTGEEQADMIMDVCRMIRDIDLDETPPIVDTCCDGPHCIGRLSAVFGFQKYVVHEFCADMTDELTKKSKVRAEASNRIAQAFMVGFLVGRRTLTDDSDN
jgi:hypothetical protein